MADVHAFNATLAEIASTFAGNKVTSVMANKNDQLLRPRKFFSELLLHLTPTKKWRVQCLQRLQKLNQAQRCMHRKVGPRLHLPDLAVQLRSQVG
jgi:hypothetical protein